MEGLLKSDATLGEPTDFVVKVADVVAIASSRRILRVADVGIISGSCTQKHQVPKSFKFQVLGPDLEP